MTNVKMKLGKNLTSSIRQTAGNGQDKLAEIIDNSCASGAKQIDICIDIESKNEQFYTIIDNGCGMDIEDIKRKLLTYGSNKETNKGLNSYGTGAKNASGLGSFEYITRAMGDDTLHIPELFGKANGIDIPVFNVKNNIESKREYSLSSKTGTIVTISKTAEDGFIGLDVFSYFKKGGVEDYINKLKMFIIFRYEKFIKEGVKFNLFVEDTTNEISYSINKKDVFFIERSTHMIFENGKNRNSFTITGKENDFKINVSATFTKTSDELNIMYSDLKKEEREFLHDGKYNPYKKNKVNLVIRQYGKVIKATDVSEVIAKKSKDGELNFRTKHNSLNELFLEIDILEGIQSTTTKNSFNRTNKAIKEFLVLLNKKLSKIGALKYASAKEKKEKEKLSELDDRKDKEVHDKLRDSFVSKNYSKKNTFKDFKINGVELDAYSEKDNVAYILETKSTKFTHVEQMTKQLVAYGTLCGNKAKKNSLRNKKSEFKDLKFPKEIIYDVYAHNRTTLTEDDLKIIENITNMYEMAGLKLSIQFDYHS